MLTKQEYLSAPINYGWQDHVDINIDILETEPLMLMAEQFNIVEEVISFLTDNPDDDLITSIETEDVLEYYYNNKLFLELDTEAVEHDCRVTFQYKIYKI